MATVSRRTFLRSSAAAAAALGATGGIQMGYADPAFAQGTGTGEDWVRVYLVVVDGLLPAEVALMPNLRQLATDGFYLPESRAQMIAETTPNHVSMITGMRADRHGMPGNGVAYIAGNVGTNPRYLQSDTIYSLIARQAPDLVTASATSKDYVVGMSKHERVDPGTEDADATNDPFIVPVSGAAIDAEVGPDALKFSRDLDPDLLWMSLGDVDRVGHTDFSGPTGLPPASRTASLLTADTQVGNLLNQLRLDGRWDNTVVLFTSDHSMDWSLPNRIVNLSGQFAEDPMLVDRTGVAQNGGAAIYWLLSPEAVEAPQRLGRMREIAMATEGVLEAWYTDPNPADGGERHWVGAGRPDWALTGDRVGDMVVVVEDGFRLTEPSSTSNPIPGNHGHIETLPIPVIIAGGWDGLAANDVAPGVPLVPGGDDVDKAERLPDQAENIDMAPTIAWLLGINPPPGGFDGRVLDEAFSRRPATRIPVADVPSVPTHDRVGGTDRLQTAVLMSRLAFPGPDGEAAPAVIVAAAGDFPDALAATPLAIRMGGPLLLTPRDALPEVVAAEIRRLGPATAVVVGGEAAVSAAVLSAIEAIGVETVTRLAGDSRYGTAAAIAGALAGGGGGSAPSLPLPIPAPPSSGDGDEGPGPDVVIASGENFPDALVAGPFAGLTGRVILLTRPGDLPQETEAAIAALNPSRIIIVGGVTAVSEAVATRLAESRDVERLSGTDRFATAAALIERAIREGGLTDRVFLVDGTNFPDALSAGAAAGALGGMLVPVADGRLADSGPIAELLDRRADGLVQITVVGGPSAISDALASEIERRVLVVRSRTGVALPTR